MRLSILKENCVVFSLCWRFPSASEGKDSKINGLTHKILSLTPRFCQEFIGHGLVMAYLSVTSPNGVLYLHGLHNAWSASRRKQLNYIVSFYLNKTLAKNLTGGHYFLIVWALGIDILLM